MSWFESLANLIAVPIDGNALHYFFSALAQCAAAFVAVIAVFAVFRLEANNREIEQRYLEAKNWLAFRAHQQDAMGMADTTVEQRLREIQLSTIAYNQDAGERLARIDRTKKRREWLGDQVAWPMLLWGSIFILGLLLIVASEKYATSWGFVGVVCAVLGTAFALHETKVFVQASLQFRENDSEMPRYWRDRIITFLENRFRGVA
jgi:hypothetical protein